MKRMAPLALLALHGCASLPAGGAGHVPATGRYAYTAEYRLPDGSRGGTFSGTLVITRADAERIAGVWEVPAYNPDLQIGAYLDGAYVANADLAPTARRQGTFEHRVSRAGAPTELRCEGRLEAREAGRLVEHPGSCTLAYLGR